MQVNIETLHALFQDSEFGLQTAKITGEKIYRQEIAGMRHYRRESGRVYKSLTTFLSAVMPQNKFLQSWREEKAAEFGSRQAAAEYVQATADYGTILHIAVAEFCRTGVVDWSEFDGWVLRELQEMGLKNGTLSAAHGEITKDFASIVQFFHEYQVKVIAVELPVWSDEGVATLIDLVVEMNAKNYKATEPDKRQRIKAIINLKSGKKGFFEEHIFQLEGERRMFNETFSAAVGYEIEKVFNLAPNDWRTSPTFDLKDQTAKADAIADEYTLLLQLAKKRGLLSTPTRQFVVFNGETKYGESPDAAIRVMEYDEFSKLKMSQLKPDQSHQNIPDDEN